MFQQTFNQIPERKTISFKATDSKSVIRIEKTKLLPSNFFKPLSIQVEPHNALKDKQEIIATPCFGSHNQQENRKFQNAKSSEFNLKNQKDEFYSWFSKGLKPLSSRVQTVPVEFEGSREKKRNLTERRGRLERVKSVQQEGTKSTFKILKKYQNLINKKIQGGQLQNVYKFKLKPATIECVEKSLKNHFKVNGVKRGYAQTKYKQSKALNSINSQKSATSFLPSILNG